MELLHGPRLVERRSRLRDLDRSVGVEQGQIGPDRPESRSKIAVTMPAYHAGETLEKTLLALPPGLDADVIVVDDASGDDTVAVARGLGLTVFVHPENRGYGGNQKTCYEAALARGAQVVVMLHPDYQYDPKAVPLLIGPILTGDADATFGSRFAGMADPRAGGMPLFRYYGNKVTTSVQNMLLGTNFTELHSGMRAYSRECLLSLPFLSYPDDFDFDSKLLADAITSGQRVIEVPIPTRYTKESSSIAIWPSLRYVGNSVRHALRARLFRGRKGRRTAIARSRHSDQKPSNIATVELECVICGSETHELVSVHDDIVQCERCGVTRSGEWSDRQDTVSANGPATDDPDLDQEKESRELSAWVLERLESYSTDRRRLIEFGSDTGRGSLVTEAERRGWIASGADTAELEDHPYDAAVMLDVLEHVVNPVAALERAANLVGEDGLVAATIASRRARVRGNRSPWMGRRRLWYFTSETLIDVFDRAGLEPIEWTIGHRDLRRPYDLASGNQNVVLVIARPKPGGSQEIRV